MGNLHEVSFVQSIGGRRLTLQIAGSNHAVAHGPERNEFAYCFTVRTWSNVTGLIELFAGGVSGYRWMTEVPDQVSWLPFVSVDWWRSPSAGSADAVGRAVR